MKKQEKNKRKPTEGKFWEKRRAGFSYIKTDFFAAAKEIITGKKTITKENSVFTEIYRFEEGEEKKHSVYTKNETATFVVLGMTLINILLLLYSYGHSYINLEAKVLSNSVLYMIPSILLPFAAWIISTNENFWAFHQRKRLFFYLCCINAVLVILQPLYSLIRRYIVAAVLLIPTNAVLTLRMLMLLAYVGILFAFGILCIIIYSQFEPLILSKALRRQIELFKLAHVWDSREDREYKYDNTTIKDLETGKPIPNKENDRMNQCEINGPSGTGKTSSIFLPVIEQDMDKKNKNREKRQEEMLRMIQEKRATIKGPLQEFHESAVIPVGSTKSAYERNKKELAKIRKKYPDCGMTVIAPNASLILDIIRLANARGMKVNTLDPMREYKEFANARAVGINPFYVPFDLSEEERVIYISQAATVFAEVLIATNQMNGAAPDVYFTDISLSVSSNIATVVMLAKNIMRQQAYIDDIQNCISNFQNIKPYIEVIENHYDVKVNVPQVKRNQGIDADEIAKAKASIDIKSKNDAKKNPYYQQLLFVAQELLGGGSEEMFSQARGLRNLINKVLQDTRIKTSLSAAEGELIDFDKILRNNEITVVNTAIELGKSSSTAFGLFFILLHKVSVLRRPMETRTPHFLWIDEASQYMHPCYEDMISLYRQYRVAVVITLQSLTQTEKSDATAYLKNVFLGAGTHIVFGRISAEEMKLYSEMGGIIRENVDQVSHTESSILTSNPNYTESVRSTPSLTNVLEGADMRILDFQELTIFAIDNGRVLPGRLARVFFLNDEAYDKRRYKTILWEKVVPEAFMEDVSINAVDKMDALTREEKPVKATLVIPEDKTESVMVQTTKKAEVIEKKEDAGKIPDIQNMSMEELFLLLNGTQGENAASNSENVKDDTGPESPSDTIRQSKSEDNEPDYMKELEVLKRKTR